MEENSLEIGAVYQPDWDERPFRIIGLDEIEVFYDCLWPTLGWSFSGNFKKKVFFYRISRTIFLKRSKKIEMQKMTSEEFNAFRPDLPMRLGRTANFNWNDYPGIGEAAFKAVVEKAIGTDISQQKLSVGKIVIAPYGPKGGQKKGEIIQSNSDRFTVFELLWKAKNIQEAINIEKSSGVGIYRLGFEKGVPSYYIGEYKDKAGIAK